MKKNLLILPLLLALAGCSNVTIINQPTTGEITPVVTQQITTPKTGFEMTALDANRNTYTNYDLGFSVQIPKGSDYFAGEWTSYMDGSTVVFTNQAKDTSVRFQTFTINSESDITPIIANTFGDNKTRTKEASDNGAFVIKVTPTMAPSKLRYSPTKKLLVVWRIGQEPNFMRNKAALDSQVITSFKFLP